MVRLLRLALDMQTATTAVKSRKLSRVYNLLSPELCRRRCRKRRSNLENSLLKTKAGAISPRLGRRTGRRCDFQVYRRLGSKESGQALDEVRLFFPLSLLSLLLLFFARRGLEDEPPRTWRARGYVTAGSLSQSDLPWTWVVRGTFFVCPDHPSLLLLLHRGEAPPAESLLLLLLSEDPRPTSSSSSSGLEGPSSTLRAQGESNPWSSRCETCKLPPRKIVPPCFPWRVHENGFPSYKGGGPPLCLSVALVTLQLQSAAARHVPGDHERLANLDSKF